MRISNISQFQGGADNVVARQYTNGDKIRQNAVHRNRTSRTAIDLSNYSYELDCVFAKGNITPTQNDEYTLNDLELVTNDQAFRTIDGNTGTTTPLPGKDISNMVATVSAADGTFRIDWPEDLYEGYVPFDTNEDVPIVVATLRIRDGASASASTNIRSVRFLLVVRHGVMVT